MKEYGPVGLMGTQSAEKSPETASGIRFLVESALRQVATGKQKPEIPQNRKGWLDLLCAALTEPTDAATQQVIGQMIASGITQREIYQNFIPDAARHLGELWVQDKASFVDVTIGASRLQEMLRQSGGREMGGWMDRSIPLGQSILMIVPTFEQHSIGAFVAADQFRRHGLWVHMAIGLENAELSHLVGSGRFAMAGITVSSTKSLEGLTELIDYLRSTADDCPPIVVGGHVVEGPQVVERRTGADFAVRTVREAIERCGLASVSAQLFLDAGT